MRALLPRPPDELMSVAWGFFIFWIWECEEIFQLPLKSLKSWPLHRIFMPTFKHDIIQSWRTTWRTLHSVAMFYLVQYFCVCHACKEKEEEESIIILCMLQVLTFRCVCTAYVWRSLVLAPNAHWGKNRENVCTGYYNDKK